MVRREELNAWETPWSVEEADFPAGVWAVTCILNSGAQGAGDSMTCILLFLEVSEGEGGESLGTW